MSFVPHFFLWNSVYKLLRSLLLGILDRFARFIWSSNSSFVFSNLVSSLDILALEWTLFRKAVWFDLTHHRKYLWSSKIVITERDGCDCTLCQEWLKIWRKEFRVWYVHTNWMGNLCSWNAYWAFRVLLWCGSSCFRSEFYDGCESNAFSRKHYLYWVFSPLTTIYPAF